MILNVQREICSLFVRTSILIRRFCSLDVKRTLIKTYCVCVYDAALWNKLNVGTSDLAASVIRMLSELRLPSFDRILHNSSIIFSRSGLVPGISAACTIRLLVTLLTFRVSDSCSNHVEVSTVFYFINY